MKLLYPACFSFLIILACNNPTDQMKPAQADADSATVVSIPVAIPDERSDTSLQDSVFSDGSVPGSWEK